LVLLRHYGPDQQALMKLVSPAGAQDLNTDLNMKLEFDAPLRLFDPDFSQRNLLGERLLRLRDGAWLARLMQMMAIEPQSPLGDWARGAQALAEKRLADAIAELRRAIQREPSLSVAYQDLSQALLQTKDELGAIDVMFAALPHRPDDAELRTSLGSLLSRHHRYQPAIEQLQQALRLDPNSVLVQMNLAWVLATCPDASMRDGRQAVRLAESACRTTHYEDGYCLDVLAAALAETGDFQRAVHLAAEAVARLQAEGQPSAPIEQRLALYHQGRPYREP
jgi:predicted Zn-dependent protease